MLVGKHVGKVRIGELLGKGGMGAVYEGFDEVLERPVAVKVISEHHRWSEEARLRFQREARVLARFQHPNVCQVYDFIEEEGTAFLVLELLQGETLSKAIKRGLSEEQILLTAEQVAMVLRAAHSKGIVHRDLKPDNIMLLPDGLVKVLDFGLARLGREGASGSDCQHLSRPVRQAGGETIAEMTEHQSAGTTSPGNLVGTLRYMSPEQALGDTAGPASDLYSFGLILQECVTREPAYPEVRNNIQRLIQVQGAAVRSVELADSNLMRLIRSLTAREHELRPSAEQVLQVLQDLRRSVTRRQRRRTMVLVGVVVTLLMAAAIVTTFNLARPRPWLNRSSKQRVALLPFINATGSSENDWLERGLQEMVAGTLARCPAIVMVEPEQTGKIARDLGATGTTTLTEEAVSSLADAFGAELIVAVEVRRGREGFLLSYDAYTSRHEVWREQMPAGALGDLAGQLSAALAQRMAPGWLPVGVEETYSTDAVANLAYAVGIGLADSGESRRAALYFRVCLDRDQGFRQASLKLAACESEMGDWDQAEELIQQVLDAARVDEDRWIEGEALRSLAILQGQRGSFEQARELLLRALQIAKDTGDEVVRGNVLNTLGRVELRQSRYDDALLHLNAARSLAVAAGSKSVEMYTLVNLGMVSWQQGDSEEAYERYTRALDIATLLRDRATELICLNNLGTLELQEMRLDEAEESFTRITELAKEIGAKDSEDSALNNLGVIAFHREDYRRAEDLWRQVLEFRKEVGDRPGIATTLNNLGGVAFQDDRAKEADALWRESLAIRKELGDLRGQGRVLISLGEAAMQNGRLDTARSQFREALELLKQVGDQRSQAIAAAQLGGVALCKGHLDEARRDLAAAKQYSGFLPQVALLEARLRYAEDRFSEAVTLQEQAKESMGEAWADEQEAILEAYRMAAATGVRVELPE